MRNFFACQPSLCCCEVNIARYKTLLGSRLRLQIQILDVSPFSFSEESASPVDAPKRVLRNLSSSRLVQEVKKSLLRVKILMMI